MARIKESPTLTLDSNIPAKLIIDGHTYDVVIESITSKYTQYDYGRDNYWSDIDQRIVHGEELVTDTFVCKRVTGKLY